MAELEEILPLQNGSVGNDAEMVDEFAIPVNYMEMPAVKVIFFACYGVVFLLGSLSNVIMLVVGIRHQLADLKLTPAARSGKKANQLVAFSVTNVLVTNLAAADILLCGFSVFFTPISFYIEDWPFGEFGCKLLPSTSIIAVCVISFTSTAIAVDRLMAICFPHSQRLTVRSALICLLVLWLLSAVCSLPVAYYSGVIYYNDDEFEGQKCAEKWTSDLHQKMFSFGTLLIQFILPAIIISCCYVMIGNRLKNRGLSYRNTQNSTTTRLSNKLSVVGNGNGVQRLTSTPSNATLLAINEVDRTLKTVRILVSMVVIFMVCWLPINVLLLIGDFSEDNVWQIYPWYAPAFFASHVMAMSCTLWNPLLYGWMNGRLRLKMIETISSSRSRRFILSPLQNIGHHSRLVIERLFFNELGRRTTETSAPSTGITGDDGSENAVRNVASPRIIIEPDPTDFLGPPTMLVAIRRDDSTSTTHTDICHIIYKRAPVATLESLSDCYLIGGK